MTFEVTPAIKYLEDRNGEYLDYARDTAQEAYNALGFFDTEEYEVFEFYISTRVRKVSPPYTPQGW